MTQSECGIGRGKIADCYTTADNGIESAANFKESSENMLCEWVTVLVVTGPRSPCRRFGQ